MFILAFLLSNAWAFTPLEQKLAEHARNPVAFSKKIPEKSHISNDAPQFDYLSAKEGCRQTVMGAESRFNKSLREAPHKGDWAQNLVDNGRSLETNLKVMDQKRLLKSKLKDRPWSDHYWPIANGGLAHRYSASIPWEVVSTWKDHFEWFLKMTSEEMIKNGKIAELSPSEKYDLLVGDDESLLTKSMWGEGKSYWDAYGDVETWMGYCHGWAAASFMLPKPTKTVVLKDLTGKHEIPFFVSDVKALGTLLFAKGKVPTRFIGGRCNDKEPRVDAENRPIKTECRDSNAATWHLSIVNQIGISQRSFVMDATYDYQVWNQPVLGYSYTYFNPETKKEEKEIEKAMVAVSDLTKDIYKKHRSSQTKYVVGIGMDVTYMIESTPTMEEGQQDSERQVRYLYDLELDENFKIVGGEWYQNAHPDFLWVPVAHSAPISWFERGLRGEWNPMHGSMDREWLSSIKIGSEEGLPAYKVVSKLFEVSSK